jgi:tetratricopeptide (TPR) repeat protein
VRDAARPARAAARRLVDGALRRRPELAEPLVRLAGRAGSREASIAALARRAARWNDPALATVVLDLAEASTPSDAARHHLAETVGAALRLEPPVVDAGLVTTARGLPLTSSMRSATAKLASTGRWDALAHLIVCGDDEVRRRIARQAARQGQFDLAVRAASAFEAPTAGELWTALAQHALDQERFELAADLAERAEPPASGPSPATEVWIAAHHALGDPSAVASRVLRIATTAQDERTRLWAAQRLLTSRWLDDAAAIARTLPQDGDGPVLEVRALLLGRRYDRAERRLEQLSARRPGDAAVVALRAELHHRTIRLDEALTDYLEALRSDTDHARADTWRLSALRIAVALGHPSADVLAEDLHARRPDDPRVRHLKAHVQAWHGVVSPCLDDPDTRSHVAAGLAEAGKLDQLRQLLEAPA